MPPALDTLIADLRTLRGVGLVRMRSAPLIALRHLVADEERWPATVEGLLRGAVAALGGGRLQEAAEYTFGLVQGTRDWPAQDRRKSAAEVYRVGADRFRKHYENIIFAQTAEALMALMAMPETGNGAEDVERALPQVSAAGIAAETWLTRSHAIDVPIDAEGGEERVRVTVHCASVDILRGIDIVVCPTNTYLELAGTFKRSVAAALRFAGAQRGAGGEVRRDCVRDEVDRWRAASGRSGLPFAPGTVAPVSVDPGCDLHFRRLYLAAVAVPRVGTNDYDVDSATIARTVRNTFRVARAERDSVRPPLTSVCFPLLGAGRGGVAAVQSFSWLWRAIAAELASDRSWQIHFVALRPIRAELIRSTLADLAAGKTRRADLP